MIYTFNYWGGRNFLLNGVCLGGCVCVCLLCKDAHELIGGYVLACHLHSLLEWHSFKFFLKTKKFPCFMYKQHLLNYFWVFYINNHNFSGWRIVYAIISSFFQFIFLHFKEFASSFFNFNQFNWSDCCMYNTAGVRVLAVNRQDKWTQMNTWKMAKSKCLSWEIQRGRGQSTC